MILSHYSSKPFVFDAMRVYPQDDHFKPRELWLSVDECDDGWKKWCENENFRTAALAHQTDFKLAPDGNVLHISTAADLRALTRDYVLRDAPQWSAHSIDWSSIKEDYDSIVIASYQWECRNDRDTFWYYSWDCASGCIWNLKAIEMIGVSA